MASVCRPERMRQPGLAQTDARGMIVEFALEAKWRRGTNWEARRQPLMLPTVRPEMM